MDGATVTAFRNNDCFQGTPASTDGAGAPNARCTLSEFPTATCDLSRVDPGPGYENDVTLRVGNATLADGGVYALRVRNALGEVVLDVRDVAHYVTTPGSSCSRGCTNANLHHAAPSLDASTIETGSAADGNTE
jgi:hypothetical protein